MYGHNLSDENALIMSVTSDGKEEYFYYVLFWSMRYGAATKQQDYNNIPDQKPS